MESNDLILSCVFNLAKINFNLEKDDIIAIFQHGSSTLPIIKNNNKDLDFIIVIENGEPIRYSRSFCEKLNTKIDLIVCNYNYFLLRFDKEDMDLPTGNCYTKNIYNTNTKKLCLPFQKDDPVVIKNIIINYENGNYSNWKPKYFYWVLMWLKDLGYKITKKEILDAHDNPTNVDILKYKKFIDDIKIKYNI